MRAVIYVRTNVDYNTIPSINEFFDQKERGRPTEIKRVGKDLYDMWDKFFSLRYPFYRNKVRSIAERNLAATGLHVFKGNYSELMEWCPNEELIIFPTDDDDWASPDFGSIIGEFDNDTKVVVWPHARFDAVRFQEVFSFSHPVHRKTNLLAIRTNNYALRRSFLLGESRAFDLIHRDGFAHSHLVENCNTNLGTSGMGVSEKAYSMYNRHIGCLSLLMHGQLEHILSLFCCRESFIPPIPDDVLWSQTYVEEFEALNRKLVSKILI